VLDDGLGPLLVPLSDEAPAGPDLSYDADRQEIEQAFDPSQEDVDWDRIVSLTAAQAARTRDLWVAVYMARAGARAGRLEVVESGLQLLAGYVETFWDVAHPTIEEYGIEGRKGACESLVRIGEFLAPLRRVPLVAHPRIGVFSGEDFVRFAEHGSAADGWGQFRAAVADTPVDALAAVLDRLDRMRAAIVRTDAILSDEAERAGQTGTNFTTTYDAIDAIVAAVRAYVVQDNPEATGEGATTLPPPEFEARPATAAATPARIDSREDVARALDAVIAYYDRVEPSSPIPVALGRVKGWITMDFVAILNDIAPGSVGEALSVLRARAASENNYDADMM